MLSEEKPEGIIVEGAKHSLLFNMSDTEESLHKCFKDFLDVLSAPNDLTDKVKDVIVSHSKPIRVHFITRNTYARYKGIKIPTKGLHNQSKNKFTSKIIKKVLPEPMNVSLSKNPKDKYSFNIDMVFKTTE